MDPYLRRDPKYQNFVTVFRGFAYVGKAVEPYTIAGLQRAHQKAYRACAGLPPCLQQCSRTHGRNTSMWCATCKAWKNALLHQKRGPYTNWENTESWNWGNNYNNIASVFLPSFWNADDIQLDDIGTACHLWTTCNEFNIGNALLKKLRELRNKHYGHNSDLKIENVEKTKVFDTLKNIVSARDVQGYLNIGQCIQDLDIIAKGDELTEFMDDIEEHIDNLCLKMDSNDATQKIFAVCVEVCISKMIREMKRQNEILGAIKNRIDNNNGWRLPKTSRVRIAFVGIVFFAMFFAILTFMKSPDYLGNVFNEQYTECVSETYSHPFAQDLHLLPYFKEHSKLFGRNWLFEDIENYIDEEGLSEKGILITADMGYGKSAIVKHLLCSNEKEKAYKIRSHITAFHLCRFDVPSTKNPQRFIHRLVGFLSTKNPEYGALISLLPDTTLLFHPEKCRKEIVACFDQGILHPLLEMKSMNSGIQIIVIDALDECYDKGSNDNAIYDLLKARYRKIPKWIQFIITSRNISLVHTMHQLKHYSLDSGDQRNKADIKQYIEFKASSYPALRPSEGLFLFVVHLLEFLTTSENKMSFEIPKTLSDVYEINFERHFDNVADYEPARSILEIITSSLYPLSFNEVAVMLETLNISSKDITEKQFEKIAFCFRSLQELTLVHQSLHSWLISYEKSKLFHVSAERGHAMFARYMLNKMNGSHVDIVDIAIHIGNANESTLAKAFSGIYSNKNVTKSTLHKLVWKSDSVSALELLLNLQIDVDPVNEGNVTPAFVAAAKGHLNQLKLLQSRGADLNFKVNDSYLITSSSQIDMIKHEYYFGYGLILIAAKFGHFETVSFLLEQNKTLRYSVNGLGLTVAEIVCENGYEKILELVSKSEADVGNCLYYAAKNNHIHIVNRLIRIGVNASCIPYTDAINASAKLRKLDMTKPVFELHLENSLIHLSNIYDLWWVVNQESPLHAAIKAKSEKTASALIKQYPHLTECVDAFGMTPFLLSATENLTNVFEILIDKVTTDTCRNVSILRLAVPDSDVPICPVGGNYAHLDGIYGRFDLTKVILQSGVAVDWLFPDSNSISPAHYAACNGNMLFLSFFYRNVNRPMSDIRSENHSTPYHSAAICGSPGVFFVAKSYKISPPPELRDIENKTLLHYVVLREFIGNPASVDYKEQVNSLVILDKLLQSEINIGASDSFMRNILHYALKNGHSSIVEYLLAKVNISFKELLKPKDILGMSPVEYARKSGGSRLFDLILVPFTCKFYDIYYTVCDTEGKFNQYLSSWELGLFNILGVATKEVTADFSNAFKDILIKSPYLTVATLVYMNDSLRLSQLRKCFIESIPHPLPWMSVYAVARHKPKLFKVCGKLLSESPLHIMAYKYQTDALISNSDFFQHLEFKKTINTYALNCADHRGYSTFHYALMGGNICMARQLFDIGVTITNTKVSIIDIAWMMLLAKKNTLFLRCYPECSDQLSCMDHLLTSVFKTYTDKILYSDFCFKNSTGLSLVHVVAASGMKHTMKILHKKFGKKVFACQNKDKISPMFLWDLLNDHISSKIFNASTTKSNVPSVDTEELLMLGLVNDFPFGTFDDSSLHCLWKKQRRPNLNIFKCLDNLLSRFKTAFSITFSLIYKVVHTFFDNTLIAQINFENALYFKHGTIETTLAGVR